MCSDCTPPTTLPYYSFDTYHAAKTIYFPLSEKACRKVKHVGLDVRGKRKEETAFWNLSFCHQTNLQRGITQQWKAENLNRKKTLKKRENNT